MKLSKLSFLWNYYLEFHNKSAFNIDKRDTILQYLYIQQSHVSDILHQDSDYNDPLIRFWVAKRHHISPYNQWGFFCECIEIKQSAIYRARTVLWIDLSSLCHYCSLRKKATYLSATGSLLQLWHIRQLAGIKAPRASLAPHTALRGGTWNRDVTAAAPTEARPGQERCHSTALSADTATFRTPWKRALTHYGLVMPYGDPKLCHHWFRWWFGAWRHYVITWNNVGSSSVLSSDSPSKEISHTLASNYRISLKLTYLKFHLNITGASGLMYHKRTRIDWILTASSQLQPNFSA